MHGLLSMRGHVIRRSTQLVPVALGIALDWDIKE